jgi:hypothetical protein
MRKAQKAMSADQKETLLHKMGEVTKYARHMRKIYAMDYGHRLTVWRRDMRESEKSLYGAVDDLEAYLGAIGSGS